MTFPNFDKDKSKKNFSLMVDFNHFDKDGTPATTHVSFPVEDVRQWKDDQEKFFIPLKGEDIST